MNRPTDRSRSDGRMVVVLDASPDFTCTFQTGEPSHELQRHVDSCGYARCRQLEAAQPLDVVVLLDGGDPRSERHGATPGSRIVRSRRSPTPMVPAPTVMNWFQLRWLTTSVRIPHKSSTGALMVKSLVMILLTSAPPLAASHHELPDHVAPWDDRDDDRHPQDGSRLLTRRSGQVALGPQR